MYAGLLIYMHSVNLFGQNVPTAPSQPRESNQDVTEKAIINGLALSEQQIADMEQVYGVKPLPGNYWYDTQSGLYGVIGYPAFGFMRAVPILARCKRLCEL